jgi:hypothetical protein
MATLRPEQIPAVDRVARRSRGPCTRPAPTSRFPGLNACYIGAILRGKTADGLFSVPLVLASAGSRGDSSRQPLPFGVMDAPRSGEGLRGAIEIRVGPCRKAAFNRLPYISTATTQLPQRLERAGRTCSRHVRLFRTVRTHPGLPVSTNVIFLKP